MLNVIYNLPKHFLWENYSQIIYQVTTFRTSFHYQNFNSYFLINLIEY